MMILTDWLIDSFIHLLVEVGQDNSVVVQVSEVPQNMVHFYSNIEPFQINAKLIVSMAKFNAESEDVRILLPLILFDLSTD